MTTKNIELMEQIFENIKELTTLKRSVSKEALVGKTPYEAAEIIRTAQDTVEGKYKTETDRDLYYVAELDDLFEAILKTSGGYELVNAIHAIEPVEGRLISLQYYIYSRKDHKIYQSNNQGMKNRFNECLEEERVCLEKILGYMIKDEYESLELEVGRVRKEEEDEGLPIFHEDDIN